MSDYTPTTEEVRGAYRAWHDGQGDDHALKPTWSADEFDRWLAAHDAEVRAGVVDEEPARMALVDGRDAECVKAWPGCHSFGYDPACCRFPKSCSAGEVRLVPIEQEESAS